MPILDIELVVNPEEPLPTGLAAQLADRAGAVFGGAPGTTWVKLHPILRHYYAENGVGLTEEVQPVFVNVLKAKLPSPAQLQTEAAQLAQIVAEVLQRPQENIHVLYQPEGAGRVAFGGRLIANSTHESN